MDETKELRDFLVQRIARDRLSKSGQYTDEQICGAFMSAAFVLLVTSIGKSGAVAALRDAADTFEAQGDDPKRVN